MKKFLVATVIFLTIVVLGAFSVQAKDKNNLDQYDRQLVADVLNMNSSFLYAYFKALGGSWMVKAGQDGQLVTTDKRVIEQYIMLDNLRVLVEQKFAQLVNNSSCGDESTVALYAWQVQMFGGLPGYVYFLPGKAKLKIERAGLQNDGTAIIKNIACARNITGLEGVGPGNEEYVKSILTTTFPGFVWGNVAWSPDDTISFGVVVLILPTSYVSLALEEPRH